MTAICFGVREGSRVVADPVGIRVLGERVRRRPTHCVVDEVHPGIVLSWSSSSSGWVALVAYGDESGVLHVGPLPAARLRSVVDSWMFRNPALHASQFACLRVGPRQPADRSGPPRGEWLLRAFGGAALAVARSVLMLAP